MLVRCEMIETEVKSIDWDWDVDLKCVATSNWIFELENLVKVRLFDLNYAGYMHFIP